MYAARLLGCEGDDNADVGSGGGVVAVSEYMGGTRDNKKETCKNNMVSSKNETVVLRMI